MPHHPNPFKTINNTELLLMRHDFDKFNEHTKRREVIDNIIHVTNIFEYKKF